MVDTRSGAYYNLGGPAAECWTLLVAGVSADGWTQALAVRYKAAEFPVIEEFLQQRLAYELIKAAGASGRRSCSS